MIALFVSLMLYIDPPNVAPAGDLALAEKVDRYLARCAVIDAERRSQAAREIKQLEPLLGKGDRKRRGETKQRLARLRKAAEATSDEVHAYDLAYGPLDPSVGDVGEIGINGVWCEQVIDDDAAIVKIPHRLEGRTYAWMEPVDTSTWVDREKVAVSGWYEVAGTKSYETVLGAQRTVLWLRPIDGAAFLQACREEHARRQQKPEDEEAKEKERKPGGKAMTDAERKVQLAEQLMATDPDRATRAANEALDLAEPNSEEARRARAVLDQLKGG